MGTSMNVLFIMLKFLTETCFIFLVCLYESTEELLHTSPGISTGVSYSVSVSNTIKILKFGTPQTIAIIVLKIEKFDVTLH